MNKAVFWDRDGVINHVIALRADGKENASPPSFNDFKLKDESREVLREVKTLGFLNFVATNQPEITRGKLAWQELNKMHDFLKAELPEISAIYVCPHDNEDKCNCRKPKPGLLLDAAKDYNLDLLQCFMVGDRQSDIDAAKAAGVRSILLKTDYNVEVIRYNFSVNNLQEILEIIK